MKGDTGSLIPKFFVGRKEALDAFYALLDPKCKQRVVFYRGDGGIGKTWLLRKIIKDNENRKDLLMPTDVIDMYSTRYHRISGVREAILEFLGEEHFVKYREKQGKFLEERDKPEEERLAESALRGLRERADDQFLEDCRNAYPDQKVVLLFDTFEKVQREDLGYYILHDLPQALPNFVFVIASREPCPINDLIKQVELKGFTPEEAQEFFTSRKVGPREKEVLPTPPIEPLEKWPVSLTSDVLIALRDRLEGHPLKLELAILWQSVGLESAEALMALSDKELDQALLRPLRSLGWVLGLIPKKLEAATYEIILAMAYLNRRFDQQFLERTYISAPPLLASLEEAVAILDMLPHLFFVKQRPDGTLQLHDEMERLVKKQLWPARDHAGDLRRELASKVIKLYDELIETSDERKKQVLRAEQLGYQLEVDLDQGYDVFVQNFDPNLDAHEYGLCELFAHEIRHYEAAYDPDRRFAIASRLARLSQARGDLDLAEGKWQEALQLAITPNQQVEAFIGLHHSTWTVNAEKGKQYLLKALEICQQEGLPLARLGRVEQLLGLTCRSLGRLEEAIEWYERCTATAKQVGKEGAWLYAEAVNSQSYVYALMGQYQKAEGLVSAAIKMRQEHEWRAEVGRSYSTYGAIKRFQGDFRAANMFYNEALRIFKELRDPEWQALILQTRAENARQIAWKHQKRGEYERAQEWLELADKHLRESRSLYEFYNLSRDRSKMLRRLGQIVRDKGRLTEADSFFRQSIQMAQVSNDVEEQLECLIDLAGIAAKRGDFGKVKEYLGQIEQFEGKVYHYPVFEGLMHMVRGDTLYAQRRWSEALKEYCAGLVLLGHAKGYGYAHFFDQLDHLPVRLDNLPNAATKRTWCRRFIEVWQQEGLDKELPKLTELCKYYEESLAFLEEE